MKVWIPHHRMINSGSWLWSLISPKPTMTAAVRMDPQRIQGVRRPKRDRVRSERAPMIIVVIVEVTAPNVPSKAKKLLTFAPGPPKILASLAGFKMEFKPINGANQSRAPSATAIPTRIGVLGCCSSVTVACQFDCGVSEWFASNVSSSFRYWATVKTLTVHGSRVKVWPFVRLLCSCNSVPDSDSKVTLWASLE